MACCRPSMIRVNGRSWLTTPISAALGLYENADGSGNQTYMIDDIAALQYMYGANFNTYAGNTVYSWSPTTGETFIDGVGQGASSANKVYEAIWDGGGIDTYNLSNYSTNLFVDLYPGDWSTIFDSPARRSRRLGDSLGGGQCRQCLSVQ